MMIETDMILITKTNNLHKIERSFIIIHNPSKTTKPSQNINSRKSMITASVSLLVGIASIHLVK